MSNPPERIWIEDEFGEGDDDQWTYGTWDVRNYAGYNVEYVRADLALPAVQPDAAALIRWHDMLLRDFGDDLSSIVRAEMLAMLDKPGKEVMPDVPNDAPNAPDAAPASTDDAGGGAEPTAVQTDAHVNETPKSEHEAANVLKLSVQGKAREAALREAAAACIWDDGDASRAAILALIDKPAHD